MLPSQSHAIKLRDGWQEGCRIYCGFGGRNLRWGHLKGLWKYIPMERLEDQRWGKGRIWVNKAGTEVDKKH